MNSSTPLSPRRVSAALTLQQAHLQRLIHHSNLTWFDYLLITVTAPGPALLPPPQDTDAVQLLAAQLTGQHSTLWQLGTEALATLLDITPQGLLSAAKMTLILGEWLRGEEAVDTLLRRWDMTHHQLRTLIARTRRLLDTSVAMTLDDQTLTPLDAYRLHTLAKMMHGFSPAQTSLLALSDIPLWILHKLMTAHITTLTMLANTSLSRLEVLVDPVFATKLHQQAQQLLVKHPISYFSAASFHQHLPTISAATPLLTIAA